MGGKHDKTLANIFFVPIKKNIKWSDVESLIVSVGGHVKQGDGSRIRINIANQSLNIHTPHPQKELKPYQVRALKKLFSEAGIQP